ncbi:MAG: hypothetical protein HY917_02075, partial [Candidatus Diapherotrites archaeon]|nr:hypothetical protein [Candidatus Diapherotrites archaeon]
ANLRIENKDETLYFQTYSFTDAQTAQINGTVNGYSFPRLSAGNFEPKTKLALETILRPNNTGTGVISLALVSDQQAAWTRQLRFNVNAEKQLTLSVQPAFLAAGVENDINVTVRETGSIETALEIPGAFVRIKDKRDNVLETDTTRLNGVAYLTIPGASPGTVYTLSAEKAGYRTEETELRVSNALVEVSPARVGFSLNTQGKFTESKSFKIRNATGFPLKVTSLKLEGEFKNILDEDYTNNNFINQQDTVIDPEQTQEFSALLALSQTGKELSEPLTLNGQIRLELVNFGQQWNYTVPITAGIGMGTEVDDPACLQLTKSEWKYSTQGEPITTEFSIKNNCASGQKAVALKNLEAKLDLAGTNQLGEYKMTVGTYETELRTGYYRLMLGTLKPEEEVTVLLTFTPFGHVQGTAKANIAVRAHNRLEAQDQVLEAKLATEIVATNLLQCISFDRQEIEILRSQRARGGVDQGGDKGAFTITTKNCGAPVSFRLNSELRTSEKEFSVADNASRTFEVQSGLTSPGMYGVQVFSRLESQKQEQIMENLRVIVQDPTQCVQLSRYEFDVLDDPDYQFDGFDSTEIANQCFDKRVRIKVNLQDFGNALKDGANIAAIAFGAGLLSKVAQGGLSSLTKTKEQLGTELESLKAKKAELMKADPQANADAIEKINKQIAAD